MNLGMEWTESNTLRTKSVDHRSVFPQMEELRLLRF